MHETLTKPRQSYVFDHKLTHEEIRELIDNFDYDAWLADLDEDGEPEPMYDRFGNPTRDTLAMMYEDEHGLGESMTLEELAADWAQMLAEIDNEESRTKQKIPA